MSGEHQLCVSCISQLDETFSASQEDNSTERRLMGKVPYESAMSLYRFHHNNKVQAVVHAMKFHGNDALCRMMGRQMGLSLVASGRFDDVDVLVPVPLHWYRWLQRGYNQSELLCRGIAEVMPRPVVTRAVVRKRYTKKQSLQIGTERLGNVEGAFCTRKPSLLAGKHVLLVDDVLTTGATIATCADALAVVPDIKISVATLCIV